MLAVVQLAARNRPRPAVQNSRTGSAPSPNANPPRPSHRGGSTLRKCPNVSSSTSATTPGAEIRPTISAHGSPCGSGTTGPA